MKLMSPKEGFGIVFSPHLIHELGVNNNPNEIKVSLKFRAHLRKSLWYI